MTKLIAVYAMAITALLATGMKQDPSEEPPPSTTTTSIVFPKPVQVLMPNDLCDNMSSTLHVYVEIVIDAPYPAKMDWADKVFVLRDDMRAAGCI